MEDKKSFDDKVIEKIKEGLLFKESVIEVHNEEVKSFFKNMENNTTVPNLSNKIGDIIIESQLHFKQNAYANSTFLSAYLIEKLFLQEQIKLLESIKFVVTPTMAIRIKQRISIFNNHIQKKITELTNQLNNIK